MITGGALSQLYWWGTIFPCCEKEENKNARHSLNQLLECGKRIKWHTDTTRAAQAVATVRSFFSPLARQTSSMGEDSIIESQWKLVDSAEEGIPEIEVTPLSLLEDETTTNNSDHGSVDSGGSNGSGSGRGDGSCSGKKRKILRIPLKRVAQCEAMDKDIIVLYPANIDGSPDKKPKELLRFQVHEQERNNFIHNLHVLMEWDRQRRSSVGELEYEETSIASRAKKVAHFAKRELEMKQTKREREKRKAKYVSESGGLKYTALALANK